MADTKAPDVIQWLRCEAGRAATLRAEKNDDGSWKLSARQRSTLWKRSRMLNRAATLLQQFTESTQ